MIQGYAIIAVPTGIVSAEIARGAGGLTCAACGRDADARLCKRCGAPLPERDAGA